MTQDLATQSVVLSGAELASRGSLLEMQNFRPPLQTMASEAAF